MKNIFLTPYRARFFLSCCAKKQLRCGLTNRKLNSFALLLFYCEKCHQNSNLWVHLLMAMTTDLGF